jgi:putative membrane protein
MNKAPEQGSYLMPEGVEEKATTLEYWPGISLPGSRRLAQFLFLAFTAGAVFFSFPFIKGIRSAGLEMNPFLQGLIFFLTAAQICHGSLSLGIPNALRLFFISFLVSFTAEWIGMHWQGMFGSLYLYDPALVPRLTEKVPVGIPLVWFWLAYTAVVFLRPLPIRGKRSIFRRQWLLKTSLGALYITAMDFIIEPLGVSTGAWVWKEPGGYFGTPLWNFAGWFICGFVICGCYLPLEKALPAQEKKEGFSPDGLFASVSIFFSLVCSTACLVRLGTMIPALLALSIMAPYWIYWAASLRKS